RFSRDWSSDVCSSDLTLTVHAELMHFAEKEGLDFSAIQEKIKAFGFENVQQSQLIELSSGEHKKLQLIKGLWQKPQLLLIDEPYTGLDKNSRQVLNQWLDELATEGISMMLISNDLQLPKCINRYIQLHDGQIEEVSSMEAIRQDAKRVKKALPAFLKEKPETSYSHVAELKHIYIRYGEKEVLKDVSWSVKVGEKW